MPRSPTKLRSCTAHVLPNGRERWQRLQTVPHEATAPQERNDAGHDMQKRL